jgi:hypothetical protein
MFGLEALPLVLKLLIGLLVVGALYGFLQLIQRAGQAKLWKKWRTQQEKARKRREKVVQRGKPTADELRSRDRPDE